MNNKNPFAGIEEPSPFSNVDASPPTSADLIRRYPDNLLGEAPAYEKDSNPPTLLCPFCKFYCTHHMTVIVNTRYHEDGFGRRVVIPNSDKPVQQIPQEEGFAGRRSDLRIIFWCEGCRGRFALQIQQHKGATFMEYIHADEDAPGANEDASQV